MKSRKSSSPSTVVPARKGKAKENQNQNFTAPLIVGVGVSTEGLQVFTALLRLLPRHPGLALVLVQHLAPTHTRAQAQLLTRTTRMPVAEATDGTRVHPDHVYVIPPDRDMEMQQATLHLAPRIGIRQHRPIDCFFSSLARDQGVKSIGVIFSGTASDGTLGLRAIKAAGGITFAQDPKKATNGEMPRSAIAAGCVDSVLPIDKIAKELLRLAHHPHLQLRPREEDEKVPSKGAGETAGLHSGPVQGRSSLPPTIEELVAANEKLSALTEKLQNRNEKLSAANNDLVHLLGSVNIPILMLGNDLRIRRFTPSTKQLMNVVQKDRGRSIHDIKLRFDLPEFEQLILDAVDSVTVKEREVQCHDGRWYSMRIRPGRTAGDEVEGTVISWVENTLMKEALDESTARYRFIFERNLAGIFYARDGCIMDCNDAFARMLGYSSREKALSAKNLDAHLTREDQEKLYERLKQEKNLENEQIAVRQKNGTPGYLMVSASLLEDDGTAGIAIDVTRRTQAERQLSGLSRSLMQESDKRRRQLARDLHDQVGSQLGGLIAMLGSLEYLPGLTQEVRDGIAQCLQVAHDCADEVRTVSHLQHPMVIDEMGLGAAVRWYAEDFSKRSGIKVKTEIVDSLRRMDEKAEIALYRIIQECLTNIQRHSGSKTAHICIKIKLGELIAEVRDFGKGFDLKNEHMGIAGMRERMRELGGRLEITSGKGGTKVRARLPQA